jgi:hypothetical protein
LAANSPKKCPKGGLPTIFFPLVPSFGLPPVRTKLKSRPILADVAVSQAETMTPIDSQHAGHVPREEA